LTVILFPRSDILSDKLYFKSLGGIIFYLCTGAAAAINIANPIITKAYLAYWSSEYDEDPQAEDVPVAR
jgi:hypothetical protein